MDEQSEIKNLRNRPWSKQKRGGVMERDFKETDIRRWSQDTMINQEDRRISREGDDKEAEENNIGKKKKIKDMECVVFVSYSPGSRLKDELQKQDDLLSEALGAPA